MKVFAKYWKLLIVLVLVGAAAFLYFDTYKTEEAAHEASVEQMKTMIKVLEDRIAKNERYADIQDDLVGTAEELEASRLALYQNFPKEMKEEDQIMYILYLESVFGTEITFPFSTPVPIVQMSDGAVLQGLFLTVNYQTTYEGFQDMIDYLATDERIVSVYEATIDYNKHTDTASGYLTLVVYLMDSDKLTYETPDIAVPETGKDNIFG